jgi:hypothetical protein
VTAGYSNDRGPNVVDSLRWLLTEEFEREMQQRFANPSQFRDAIAQRRGCSRDVPSNLGREIDGEKESQPLALFKPLCRPTPTH